MKNLNSSYERELSKIRQSLQTMAEQRTREFFSDLVGKLNPNQSKPRRASTKNRHKGHTEKTNEFRESIFAAIKSNPGIRGEGLRKLLGPMTRGQYVYNIQCLREAGAIRSTGVKRAMQYFSKV